MGRDIAWDAMRGVEEDDEVRGNVVFSHYRANSLDLLLSAFGEGDRVLDLGCGSGLEAVILARNGVSVIGLDPVEGRVQEARSRARDAQVHHLVDARVLGSGGLSRLLAELGTGSLDGAYSSFGALNCTDDLPRAAEDLYRLLRPGVPFVTSVMNRVCPWDVAGYLARLRPGDAFRRFGGTRGRTAGKEFTVAYFTAADLERAFSPWFRLAELRGYPMLPPPRMDRLFRRMPGYLEWAASFDPSPLRGLGDHLFAKMIRT